MVHFDGGDESSGVKWYIILIIILVALIVIGVIVGMYQKLKKKNTISIGRILLKILSGGKPKGMSFL